VASEKMAKQPLSSKAKGSRDLGEGVMVESSIFGLGQNRRSGRESFLSPRDSHSPRRPPETTSIIFRCHRDRFAVESTSEWKSTLASQDAGSAFEVGLTLRIFGLMFQTSLDSRTHKISQQSIFTADLK
jgi:hypothetical protein